MSSYNFSHTKDYYHLLPGENIEGLYFVLRRIRSNTENRLWLWLGWGHLAQDVDSSLGKLFVYYLSTLGKNYTYRNYGNELVGLSGENQLFEYWVEWKMKDMLFHILNSIGTGELCPEGLVSYFKRVDYIVCSQLSSIWQEESICRK